MAHAALARKREVALSVAVAGVEGGEVRLSGFSELWKKRGGESTNQIEGGKKKATDRTSLVRT